MRVYKVSLESTTEWTYLVKASSKEVANNIARKLLIQEFEKTKGNSDDYKRYIFMIAEIVHSNKLEFNQYRKNDIDATEGVSETCYEKTYWQCH